MTISGRELTTLQRCPRKLLLERSGEVLRWSPTGLLSACLRGIVLDLSSGKDKTQVARDASIRFRNIAADPGLDISTDPWTLAGDLCALLENFTEALYRLVLLPVKLAPAAKLEGLDYQPGAFQDEAGSLHRWATVEKVNDDTLSRELHSWMVTGDMAALDLPLTLHLVEIGYRRNGHQHSPWSRALQHPSIKGRVRFQSKHGRALQGQWKPLWAQDSELNPESWVDLMAADNLELIHHLEIKQLSPGARDKVRRDIHLEAKRLEKLEGLDWEQLPIYRPACDLPSTCPWQFKCYG